MITFDIYCVLLAAPTLVYLGATFLRRTDRTDRTLGAAFCLTSLFALFYGGASLWAVEEERNGFQFIARILLGGTALVAWAISLVFAVNHSAGSIMVKFLIVGLVVLFTLWMAASDAQLDSQDLPLWIGLALWLAAEGTELRRRNRSHPQTEEIASKEIKWKRSA